MRRRRRAIVIVGALALAGCSTGRSTDNSSNRPGPVITADTTPRIEPPVVPSTASAETPTLPVPTTVVSSVPTNVYDFSAIAPIVQGFVDERGLNGAGLVIVDRDDGIVHEEYWGEFGPDRVSLFASSSKSIVAGVLLRLADLGLLDLDAPIADAVSWGATNPDITPAQLLSNSSGLVGLGPNPAYLPYICQFRPQGDLQTCGSSIFTTTADDGDVVAPDTQFRYGGGQWQVAGAVAEAVSGKSWAELIDDTYVEPCGVDSLGFNNHWTQFGAINFTYPERFGGDPSALVPTANPNMEGGGYSTARDYAELLLMQLRDGRCGDTQVLSPASVERLHRDRIEEVSAATDDPRLPGYALGWFVDRSPGGYLTDPGAYGSVPWLDLVDGYGAYLIVEADNRSGVELARLLYTPIDNAMTRSG
jgi:CubicO group peptidase (beta-lactamase class C family)